MDLLHSRPVIASLYSRVSSGANSPHRSSSSHPLSSVALSPDGSHAVASGRDVLHVLNLSLNKDRGRNDVLKEIRSVRISQYFQAPSQPSGGAITRPQYPHVHDILSAQAPSVTTPTAGGGGGVNVTVTDVAWSLTQSYLVDNNSEAISPGGDSSTADSLDEGADSEHHPGHYPSFIKRVRVGTGKSQFHPSNVQTMDDSSVVAASGSNGVVVAWHSSALLADATNSPSNHAQSGIFHDRRERSVSTSSSIGQPEAVFLAHSRAVNRLAWHPTGNRPYLMLTASQDGTVKLWDRRASSAPVTDDKPNAALTVPNMRTWFGFGTQITANRSLSTSAHATTSNWHCVSTYTPKCEAIRDIKWNPFIEDVFAMVSDNGSLCVYDIRLNRPVLKTTSAHAGEATSVDWHPSDKYVLATGGGRDRLVKVWDTESSLNIHKQDEVAPIVSNSASYVSGCTDSSGENANKVEDVDTGSSGRNTPNQLTYSSLSTNSPIKRNVSGLALSRHHKLYIPLHTLYVSSPITSISWHAEGSSVLADSIIAVSTSPISGANAGGNGVIGLWTCSRPFVPLSIVEGHEEGAVSAFAFVFDTSIAESTFNRRLTEPTSSVSPLTQFESPLQGYSRRRLSDMYSTVTNLEKEGSSRSLVLSVGRDGQCLLQDFSLGERPILQVPKSAFALASLSPFQPGFGSLQIMSVHHNPATKTSSRSLVFSVTDQGDAEDLTSPSGEECVDISPELTHISRFSELYLMRTTGNRLQTKADVCRHNASVAGGLNRQTLSSMWKTLAIILESSVSGALSSLLTNTVQNLLLQRADAGDVQTCVVICEVMDVILPPAKAGDTATSTLPNVGIEIIREWYLSYIDLLQQMCLFTQAASLIRNCKDPVIGALNQQSTTINESCPICSKPLMGGESVEHQSGASRQPMSQRVCRSCRGKIGLCFLCHERVNGVFVWCPGCGHGGHLDHALEWFQSSDVCPTGCGHKCNLLPVTSKR